MKAYLTTAAGERFLLPPLVEWEMSYGCGTPCDSFQVRCVWTCGEDDVLAQAVWFTAQFQGETVFTGVVDECLVEWSAAGSALTVSGRGMAALLLDNEAEGMDYEVATAADILRDHVTPYGIRVARQQALPGVERFSVASGSSEWAVLYQFARYHGGVTPRFDREGRLILADWEDGTALEIGDRTPVVRLAARDRRYGVLSEVWVRDRTRQAVEIVENSTFKAAGGQCRRIYTMPGKSHYQAMRYQGAYQLDRSSAGLLRLEAELALPLCAWSGDLVRLKRTGWGRNGLWRVAQATATMDERGYRTVLELVPPDTLL